MLLFLDGGERVRSYGVHVHPRRIASRVALLGERGPFRARADTTTMANVNFILIYRNLHWPFN